MNKFDPSSSSSESESEPNLGGYEVPEFEFSLQMFRLSSQQDIEKKIAAIDLHLSKLQAYRYQERGYLEEEKKILLQELESNKGKQKVEYSKSISYNPADLYKDYQGDHESRQQFRKSRMSKLRLEIKEKQKQLRQLCSEIEELKSAVKVIQIERDQSSDEYLGKHYEH